MQPGRKYNNNKIGKQQCAIIEGDKVLWQVYHDFMQTHKIENSLILPLVRVLAEPFLLIFPSTAQGSKQD